MKNIFSFILIILTFISKGQNISTKGTEFWLAYMENLDLAFNGPPAFSIIISSDVNTSGTISLPDSGLSISYNVIANHATVVTLPQIIFYPQGDENIINLGIKVTSLSPVNVYAYHHRARFTEASIVLPISELSDQYLIIANKIPSEFVVEATSDSTTIQIIPSAITLSGRPPNIPFNVLLNEGQVFQLQGSGDFTGSVVKSLDPQKKIAVFAGARTSIIYCNPADNTLYDQVYPESSAGTSFITVPFLAFNMGYDYFRFTATMDSTYLTINSQSIFIAGRGELYDTLMSSPANIVSTNPIFVTQYKTSGNCAAFGLGDPSMLNLTPLNLKTRKAIFHSLGLTFVNPHHYVNIITATNSTGLLTVDGNLVTGFQQVPSNPAFSYTTDSLSAGEHIIESDSGFNAYAYGIGLADAYSFHLGYDDFLSTGINDIPGNDFDIYTTNPVTETIQLTLNTPFKSLKVELYNILGNLMHKSDFTNDKGLIVIDVSTFNKGFYFLRVYMDKKVIIKKIVKD